MVITPAASRRFIAFEYVPYSIPLESNLRPAERSLLGLHAPRPPSDARPKAKCRNFLTTEYLITTTTTTD